MDKNYTVIRARVPLDIKRRFKASCAKMDVSVPKQISELLRKFVEVQEYNEKIQRM